MIVPEHIQNTLSSDVASQYRQWSEYMERNISFSLRTSYIHTKAHAERVLLYALLIAEKMKTLLPADAPQMLAHAAVFHDTRRNDDGYDVGHGARAAVHYKEYAGEHYEVKFYSQTHFAMAYHDRDDEQGIAAIQRHYHEQEEQESAILIYQIFKDADALDRFRLGPDGLDERYLRTNAARELVSFAKELVSLTIRDKDMPKKMLLIVDPQNDFISGSLPVPGAAAAMDSLSDYIRQHADDYELAVVTSDWHPYNHSSFTTHGGPWPEHCVQHSSGAAIYQPLLGALNECLENIVVYKGDSADKEEYSIFDNEASAQTIAKLIADRHIMTVDVCGLAGDVCVLNTWQGGRALHSDVDFRVLEEFAPSLDGGKTLHYAITSSHE